MSYPDSPAPPLHSGSNANTRGLLTRRHSPYALARTVIGPPPAPSTYASVAVWRETSLPFTLWTSTTSTSASEICAGCGQLPCVSPSPRATSNSETAPVILFESTSDAASADSSQIQLNGADLSPTVIHRRISDMVRTVIAKHGSTKSKQKEAVSPARKYDSCPTVEAQKTPPLRGVQISGIWVVSQLCTVWDIVAKKRRT